MEFRSTVSWSLTSVGTVFDTVLDTMLSQLSGVWENGSVQSQPCYQFCVLIWRVYRSVKSESTGANTTSRAQYCGDADTGLILEWIRYMFSVFGGVLRLCESERVGSLMAIMSAESQCCVRVLMWPWCRARDWAVFNQLRVSGYTVDKGQC